MRPQNLFEELPDELPQELVQALLATPGIRIERIVSKGHVSPPGFWYDQPTSEWVLLVRGAARLRFERGESPVVELTKGSYLNIPAHARHRVEWTDPIRPTVWLAIHYS